MITVKSYVFHAELEQEEDGRWSAWIEALLGCATWGHNREEALEFVRRECQERCKWKKGHHEACGPWCSKKCGVVHKKA